MEQHPVPRNISGFQFRLIGDMTLKQFGYLAGGALIGYLIYSLFPLPPLFKYPLVAIVVLGGAALAFLPIQDRPLDKWLIVFIKSITSPTQFLWQKYEEAPEILTRPYATSVQPVQEKHVQLHHESNLKLKAYLASLPVTTQQTYNTHEKQYIDQTLALFGTPVNTFQVPSINTSTPNHPHQEESVRQSQAPTQVLPSQPVTNTPMSVSSPSVPAIHPPHIPATIVSPPIQSSPVNSTLPIASSPSATVTNIGTDPNTDDKLKKLLSEKENLARELEALKKRMETEKTTVVVKPQFAPLASNESTVTKVNADSVADTIGMPSLTENPNMVVGVVKDPGRKILPNIILTIKDSLGTPVRALKTNKLGQFATATPLQNGNYVLELEDPMKRYVFENIEIILNGTVFLPVEILAKGQREIAREQLNKAIFGELNPTSATQNGLI